LAIVPRSHIPRGFIDSNMDDEEDGSYFDRLQKDALAASVRSAVSISALWMASVIDIFAGPSESAVNLTSKFGIQRSLFTSSMHLSNILLDVCKSLDLALLNGAVIDYKSGCYVIVFAWISQVNARC
jgi:hypothetical protein